MRSTALMVSLVCLVLAGIPGCSGGGGGSSFLATPSGGALVTLGIVEASNDFVVNGVTFATPFTTVSVDDRAGRLEDVQPGHVVRVSGSLDRNGVATARHVELDSNVIGPVELVAPDGRSVVVLGQVIQIGPPTAFDPAIQPPGPSGLAPGDVIRVSGVLNGDETISASRIDLPPAGADPQVSGVARNVDPDLFLFNIGGLTIDYGFSSRLAVSGSSTLEGLVVQVRGELDGSGIFIASSLATLPSSGPDDAGAEVRLDGSITGVVSPERFDVNGFPVAVTPTTLFEDGSPLDLRLGRRVAVEGVFESRIARAERIRFDRRPLATRTLTLPFDRFDRVSVAGPFTVTLEQQETFEVVVTVDVDFVSRIEAEQVGDELRLGIGGGSIETRSGVNTLEVVVRMPELSAVELTGAARGTVSSFQSSRIEVDLSGAATLTGSRITADDVSARLTGAARLCLVQDCALGSALTDLSSASRATLRLLDGGSLSGSLTFASTLFYYGNDVDVDVQSDFTSSVARLGP